MKQVSGEDHRDYLKRVERLSRDLNFFSSENQDRNEALQVARSALCLSLAVNGLRNKELRRELMSRANLTWELLCDILRSRSGAMDAMEKLSRGAKSEKTAVSHSTVITRV